MNMDNDTTSSPGSAPLEFPSNSLVVETQKTGSLQSQGTEGTQLLQFAPPRSKSLPDNMLDELSKLTESTDVGNGEAFANLYQNKLRFNHQTKKWLVWKGNWWQADNCSYVRECAKNLARYRWQKAVQGLDAMDMSWAIESMSKRRIDACIDMAKSAPPLADTGEGWNSDPWLLGVANGVVNLKEAALRPGEPGDRITMHTDVPYDPTAECPRWEQFLREIFNDDYDLIFFVQEAIGYSLSADVSEQCLFLCWGSGSNGKSVFLKTIQHVFGDYAHNLPFSAFELAGRSSIPNDVASIKSKRFVTAIETAEDCRLNETRVKALTGGDEITARFLYQEFFRFPPTSKFWLAFNHKPIIRDHTHSMWRRIRLIPFAQRFEGKAQDKRLQTILQKEAAGILRWAVEGCLLWQGLGLEEPEGVREATTKYRTESDQIGNFLAECCIRSDGAKVTSEDLSTEYQRWAGESAQSWKAVTKRLQEMGFKKKQLGPRKLWHWPGLGLATVTGNSK